MKHALHLGSKHRVLAASLALCSAGATLAQSVDAHIAPGILRKGTGAGQENPSAPLTLTAWLSLHTRGALDARVQALYTPGSPSFHHWLTAADLGQYAPTAAEMAAVQAELKAHNLSVVSADPLNLSVRFTGKTSDVESAFGTQINLYTVGGKLVRTSTRQPQLGGAAAGLVQHLAGLNSMQPRPAGTRPRNAAPGHAAGFLPASAFDTAAFTSECFSYPQTLFFSDSFSTATYNGLVYSASGGTAATDGQPACAYTPAQLQKVYGLDVAFGLGYTGAGQTIVFINAGAYPSAQAELSTFSSLFALPAITSGNFQEVAPYGTEAPSATAPAQLGADSVPLADPWAAETGAALQWAHATAPGADLVLLNAFSADTEELQAATLYAITNHLGNIISGGFAEPESMEGAPSLAVWNEIIEMGAAEGIALNFASGDQGDYSDPDVFFPNTGSNYTYSFSPTEVSAPADSPFATAVGGTTIAISPTSDAAFTTGWGTASGPVGNARAGYTIQPLATFMAGSGGGPSAFFPKPGYQANLPGTARLLPDIAALADPNTGAEYVLTVPATTGTPSYQSLSVSGGTGLASAIFSGIWAVINDYAGAPLGQAAPYLAATQGSLVADVLPIEGPDNVTATTTYNYSYGSGTNVFSAAGLVPPLFGATQFISALVPTNTGIFGENYSLLTFGTDLSLVLTEGWDSVTGYGTPSVGTALLEAGAKPKQ